VPELVIIAGPNGSGKSTLTEPTRLKRLGISFPENYINADEIAKSMRETHSELSQEEREKAAFHEARAMRKRFREQRASYAFETVFSHPSTLLDIQQAQAIGYYVTLLFVTTANPEINVWRVVGRVSQGGHNVPQERIRSRYRRTLALLPRIVEEVDTSFVFDSTEERQTRLCFQTGLCTLEKSLPPYLQRALLEPLNERQKEREFFGVTVQPNEANGTYVGEISLITAHYVLQRMEDNLIRHDRLLLRAELSAGQVVTIKYRDGEGSVVSEEGTDAS
jgi:predicted ABC-type ATPase